MRRWSFDRCFWNGLSLVAGELCLLMVLQEVVVLECCFCIAVVPTLYYLTVVVVTVFLLAVWFLQFYRTS